MLCPRWPQRAAFQYSSSGVRVLSFVMLLGESNKGLPQSAMLSATSMISIVDDDTSVREAAECLVRSLGYTVMTFSSAEEFLKSGRVDATACLISDIQMPGLSGAELQDRLIAEGHHTPMIFMSGDPDEELRGRVLSAGAIGYLSKPFNESHLIEYIDTALNSGDGASAEPDGSSAS